jgi:hypothetical protein
VPAPARRCRIDAGAAGAASEASEASAASEASEARRGGRGERGAARRARYISRWILAQTRFKLSRAVAM